MALSFRRLIVIVTGVAALAILALFIAAGVKSGLEAGLPLISLGTPFPEVDHGEWYFYARGFTQGIFDTLLVVFLGVPLAKRAWNR